MKGRFQKQLHPGVVATIIFIVFVAVQWLWWRGLIYQPPGVAGTMGPSAAPKQLVQVIIPGRTDVTVDTLSGDLAPGDEDGPGHAARFDRPTGIALDTVGNVYVADTGNNRIRMIAPDGTTTTFAGGESGYQDGPALQARFNNPCGICATPDDAIYVADTGNHCIRRIFKGQVTTIVGAPSGSGGNTSATSRKLNLPTSVVYVPGVAPALLTTDPGDKALLKFRLDGGFISEQTLPGAPTSAGANTTIAIAIPQNGMLQIGAATLHNVPVEDENASADPRGPFLKHPVSVCSFGSDWLASDNDHGAIFLIHNGKASVLAGRASTVIPFHGNDDSDGMHSLFSTVYGIVSDGKKLIYVADTKNNCIRRLTYPGYLKQ